MPHLPSRKSLENMKRVDLQRICKEYGVKANLKSEALIDLLLDTQSPRVPPPAPPPPTTRRSSSTKISTKAGPSRISSMIVHDTDDEADDESANIPEESPPEEPPAPPPVPPPRTRKGKEQMRLGVGKPVIAGGQGARAVTRSSGSLKRTKSSRTIRPREVTIPEESEPPTETPDTPFDSTWTTPATIAGPSQQPLDPIAGSSMDINQLIRAAVAPLEEQIRQLKAEVAITGEIKNELQSIKTQLAHAANAREGLAVRLDGLAEVANMVASLQEDMAELKVAVEGGTPPRPSTPKGKNPRFGSLGFGLPSSFRPSGQHPPAFEPPGTPTQPATTSRPKKPSTTLGKRPREPTINLQAHLTTEDGGIAQTRKRPKLLVDHSTPAAPSSRGRGVEALPEGPDLALPGNNGSAAAFTVYTDGSNPSDFLANTSDLPDFFRESSPVPGPSNGRGTRAASGAPITSTANAVENQGASFTFPFPPIQPYPAYPFADDRGSPSPLPHSEHGIGDERGLIFKATGFPTTSTVRPRYASVEGRSVDPSSLSLTRDQHGPSGSSRPTHADGAVGLDQPDSLVETEGSTRKTMYGTELESDTRFGDFGMDGVASGYWTYS